MTLFPKLSRQASVFVESLELERMGRLRRAATARPTCGQVDVEILVAPVSKNVALLRKNEYQSQSSR